MKADGFAKVLLLLIAGAVIVVAFNIVAQSSSVHEQTTVKYGYLIPQAGSSRADGGKYFVDMRNGDEWECYQGQCKVYQHFPLEQTLALRK